VNTKYKGDNAIGKAIEYYISSGYEVCLPVGDKRPYDLIVEKNGKTWRVQVKYAGWYPKKQKCFAGLRITGGNRSNNYAKKYKDDEFDVLFVYTETGNRYHIPWQSVDARSELSIDTNKYLKYRV
jgi:hypothetical protein